MDLKLTTTTEDLRELIEGALDGIGLGEDYPGIYDSATQAVLDTLARQAVLQLGPQTFERSVLAALDRSLTGCLPFQGIYRAATGRDAATLTEIRVTTDVLGYLISDGLVARGSGPQGEAGEWFFIMPKGRTKLHA